MSDDNWKKFYYLATFIIAFIAILGFIYSIKSSKEITKTLEIIQQRLIWVTDPMLKISNIGWVVEDTKAPISCNSPPIGLKVEFANCSNVAVQTYKIELRVFIGENELKEIEHYIGSKEIILPPNAPSNCTATMPKSFKAFLGRQKDRLSPPHLNFILEIEYSRLHDNKRYLYITKREILFDCRKPETFFTNTIKEEVKTF
ncbi:MAG: hypothetical protein Q8M54_08175 [Desulfobaccales bacterium]|nr:hypothetical protein [Desulfobaccales bacterium]